MIPSAITTRRSETEQAEREADARRDAVESALFFWGFGLCVIGGIIGLWVGC